jgi:hypothetical protein
MLPSLLGPFDYAGFLERIFQQGVTVLISLLHQLLMEMLDGEIVVLRFKQSDHPHGFINRYTAGGDFPDASVNQAAYPFLGKAPPLTVKSADGNTHHFRSLLAGELVLAETLIDPPKNAWQLPHEFVPLDAWEPPFGSSSVSSCAT